MLSKVYSAAINGIEANLVTIETIVEKGINFVIVGLPDTAVKESHERIISAIKMSGITPPHQKVLINLSPADVKKEGAGFDLPMAVGVLVSSERITVEGIERVMMIGELALDGTLMPVRGALPAAIKARELGFEKLIVPSDNVTEAAVVNRLDVYGADNLTQVIEILTGSGAHEPVRVDTRALFAADCHNFDYDFSEVK